MFYLLTSQERSGMACPFILRKYLQPLIPEGFQDFMSVDALILWFQAPHNLNRGASMYYIRIIDKDRYENLHKHVFIRSSLYVEKHRSNLQDSCVANDNI